MELSAIDGRAVRHALARAEREFHTHDVSDQQSMIEAHPLREPSYHALVGRYLSTNQAALELDRLLPLASKRGALWFKRH
jgi:hypothetical protein